LVEKRANAAGGAAGSGQNRQGFDGKAQPLVQHGEQDLVTERYGGWPALSGTQASLDHYRPTDSAQAEGRLSVPGSTLQPLRGVADPDGQP
jgi:hypothetical protein